MQDPVAVRKALGQRVRALRAKRKWSQEDLAHESGLARSFTGAIGRGEKDLRLSTLIKLADTFRIPISHDIDHEPVMGDAWRPLPVLWGFLSKKTRRRRIYCSRRCSSTATAVPSVSRKRQMVQADRIRCAQDAISECSKAKRSHPWKDWVSKRTGYNVKWITRAVTNGHLRPPSGDR